MRFSFFDRSFPFMVGSCSPIPVPAGILTLCFFSLLLATFSATSLTTSCAVDEEATEFAELPAAGYTLTTNGVPDVEASARSLNAWKSKSTRGSAQPRSSEQLEADYKNQLVDDPLSYISTSRPPSLM